jgi:hypothetical protein
MSLRIVLHAEGPGETRGAFSLPPAPGSVLSEDGLGPGHLLVRRVAEAARGVPAEAIAFLAPLRSSRGVVVRGSMLLERTTLRQLLTWPSADRRPDVAIVLVDADGDPADRRALLQSHVVGITLPTVLAIAVQEFESWLISDQRALNAVAGAGTARPPHVEDMKPREAKTLLAGLANHQDAHGARCGLARTLDLDVLCRESASFARFAADLRGSG